jgi:hypothetical protein
MNIKIVVAASLLCAGCADTNPFTVFYVPGYQTDVGPVPAYSGPPLPPAAADPPVEYVPVISADESKRFAKTLAAQGYSRIGMSLFETNWPAPHRDDAAEMGRKLGANLVLYVVVPVGTRLQSVPHITYEPGQTYSGTTSGFVGGAYGSFSYLPLFTGKLAHAIHDRGGWEIYSYRRVLDQKKMILEGARSPTI